VHLRLTMGWATEEGLTPEEAQSVATADVLVDELWPGHRKWWHHFNPPASLLFAPLEMARAVRAYRAGERVAWMTHLGRSLHSRQDAVGHGRLGLNHLAWNAGLLGRDPDEWELMPASVQDRIERATRRALARFLRSTGKARPTT
jgi:hypothetical protein